MSFQVYVILSGSDTLWKDAAGYFGDGLMGGLFGVAFYGMDKALCNNISALRVISLSNADLIVLKIDIFFC